MHNGQRLPSPPLLQQRGGGPEIAKVVIRRELYGPLDYPTQPVEVAAARGLGGAQVEKVEQCQPGPLALLFGPVLVAVLGQQVPSVARYRPSGDGRGQRQVRGRQGLGAAGFDEELGDVDPHRSVEHQHVPLPDQDVAGQGAQTVEDGPQPVAAGVPAALGPYCLDGLLGVDLPAAYGDVLEQLGFLPGVQGHGPARLGELEATEHGQRPRQGTGLQGQGGRLARLDSQAEKLLGDGALTDQGELGLAQAGRFFTGPRRQGTGLAVLAPAEGGEGPQEGNSPVLAGVGPSLGRGQ